MSVLEREIRNCLRKNKLVYFGQISKYCFVKHRAQDGPHFMHFRTHIEHCQFLIASVTLANSKTLIYLTLPKVSVDGCRW